MDAEAGKIHFLRKPATQLKKHFPAAAQKGNTHSRFLIPWPAPDVEKAVAIKREKEAAVRVVAIDSFSPRMLPPSGPYTLRLVPAKTLSELRILLDKYLESVGARIVGWAHFIKHKRTLDVLRTEFNELPPAPNRETYRYEPGDVILVAVLRRKPTRSDPCVPAGPDDLSYWLVTIKPESAKQ